MLLGSFRLAQQILDALAVLFRFVQDEENFRRAAHVQAFDEFVPDVAGRRLQTFKRRAALGSSPAKLTNTRTVRMPAPKRTSVTMHGQRQSRIFQFACQHQADFVADFLRDAFRAMSLNVMRFPILEILNFLRDQIAPEHALGFRGDRLRAIPPDVCTSPEMLTTPTRERCQSS